MRILLVTWTDQLLEKLLILNPELEYCAIVVDEVEPAKKILEKVGLSKDLLYPMYEMKECCRDFYYDYVLCVENKFYKLDLLNKVHDECGVSWDKISCFDELFSAKNFLVERALRYFKEHATEFEMFATGISYTAVGLDVSRFKRKLFNFGRGSQDLYYNFQAAKYAIACVGGHSKLCYALIGIAPFSFYFDQSKTPTHKYMLLQYFIGYGELHNFVIPVESYKKFFREEYFKWRLPLEPFDLNDPFQYKGKLRFMTPEKRLEARKVIDIWNERYFPEVRTEYIKILDDYLTLCENNDIRPIMFLVPTSEGHMKYFNRQKLDEFYYLVEQACKKHPSAVFIDGWKLQGFTDADFYDVDHLNLLGAAKFSAFLNDFIESLE